MEGNVEITETASDLEKKIVGRPGTAAEGERRRAGGGYDWHRKHRRCGRIEKGRWVVIVVALVNTRELTI